jgi:hypothetical protein
VTRIGSQGTQKTGYMAGIYGTMATGGFPVYVLSTGQLVHQPSSAKFKRNIHAMGRDSDALMALRPVTFEYKTDPTGLPQFGLVRRKWRRLRPTSSCTTATTKSPAFATKP